MANNYQEYNDYLKKMQDQMISRAETIEYNPQSASTLKSALAKALRPDVDRAIQSRQKTAAQNRAAIDADAAARGMGSSTWVTDVKNRQNDAAASDISNLEGDYISTLYGNLLNRMGAQEQNKLSVDQFNASQRQAALDRAQAATDQWWQTWSKKPTGGGGGGGGDYAAYLKWLQEQQAKAATQQPTIVRPDIRDRAYTQQAIVKF
ncbi:MAG: hypothetical protein IIU73_03120 [Selenomonadales bacterium]|nr:hypothetical protein [Selenomonadales bacterium]